MKTKSIKKKSDINKTPKCRKSKPTELDNILDKFIIKDHNEVRFRYYESDKTKTDWYYVSGMTIDYSRDYDCENNNCDNDICRCSSISNATIKEFNINTMIDSILEKTKNIYLRYCIDRIIRQSKINKDSFNIPVVGGYYGDEINGVYLYDNINNSIHKKIAGLKDLSDIDKVKYILNLEYGYLLKDVENAKEIKIVDINIDESFLSQEEYFKKVDISGDWYGEKFNLPRGIFLMNGDKFRLIDGYHRVVKAKSVGIKIVQGIVLY